MQCIRHCCSNLSKIWGFKKIIMKIYKNFLSGLQVVTCDRHSQDNEQLLSALSSYWIILRCFEARRRQETSTERPYTHMRRTGRISEIRTFCHKSYRTVDSGQWTVDASLVVNRPSRLQTGSNGVWELEQSNRQNQQITKRLWGTL